MGLHRARSFWLPLVVAFFGAALTGACALPVFGAGSASATVIDFDALEVVGSGNTSTGTAYTEDGFLLTAVGSPNPHFQFFETLEPRYPGSTALFISVGAPTPGSAMLEAVNADPFNLVSIDLALRWAA